MPYSLIKAGKDKGKYRVTGGKMKGKVVSKAQMQAIEISKHGKGKKKTGALYGPLFFCQ